MKKSALLLSFIMAGCMLSAHGKASVEFTDADWLSAAKTALRLTSRTGAVTFVVDDSLSQQARSALESLRKVVPLVDMPDRSSAFSGSGEYLRILQFRPQGDRIEFLEGSVYPKVYQAEDCRVTTHLFLTRTADGEWVQDGPAEVKMCVRH